MSEIWAYGLRNPWRCSYDYSRPQYFICGDVGQNRVEEVDLIVKGGNYGWNKYEGSMIFDSSAQTSNVIFPVLEYSHTSSQSVCGGYFYRSSTYKDSIHQGKVGIYFNIVI